MAQSAEIAGEKRINVAGNAMASTAIKYCGGYQRGGNAGESVFVAYRPSA
jgi:hypothetical protein